MKTTKLKITLTVLGSIIIGSTYSTYAQLDGLVACYPLDGQANDTSGHGNHGTLNGGVAFGTNRFGTPNAAGDFNGAGAFVLVPDASSLDLTSFTIAAWVFPRETNRVQACVTKMGYGEDATVDANYNMIMMSNLKPRAEYEILGDTQNVRCDSSIALTLNQWQHVAITREATSGRLAVYVNGILTGETFFPVPPVQQNQPVRIGADAQEEGGAEPGNAFRYFNGKMDDVRIYNRALSTNEVRALYLELSVQVASVAISWNSLPGIPYQVEYRSTLTTNNWVTLGAPTNGTGSRIVILDSVLDQPQKFYRVNLP